MDLIAHCIHCVQRACSIRLPARPIYSRNLHGPAVADPCDSKAQSGVRIPPPDHCHPRVSLVAALVLQQTILLTMLALPLYDRASDLVQAALRQQEDCARVALAKLLAHLLDIEDLMRIA